MLLIKKKKIAHVEINGSAPGFLSLFIWLNNKNATQRTEKIF